MNDPASSGASGLGFHVHRANRLESLIDIVAALPPVSADPFTPETFVIPTRGLERWLGMQLAERHGIFANARFVTIEDLLDGIIAASLPDDRGAALAWRPGHLVWHIAEVLGQAHDAELAPLLAWMGPRPSDGAADAALDARTLQLAERMAEVFYRYALYRDDVVEGWLDETQRGSIEASGQPGSARPSGIEPGDRWQAALWRKVTHHIGDVVPWPGRRLQALTAALDAGLVPPVAVPSRIVLFGHHTLAPLHLDALIALGRTREVHLLRPACAIGLASDENVRAHALRASLDRLGIELDKLLDERHITSHDHIDPPPSDSALHHLQASILAGRTELPAMTLAPTDRSLRLHICHGALRQVEALRDDLLRLFDEDPTLEPRDVCVMTPDIETFAPLIDAVFRDGDRDVPEDDPRNPGFPALHKIHDVSLRRANPQAEAFLAILDLVGGRLPRSTIVDLLAMTPVLDKIEVDPDDLDRIRGWLRSAGIRWGLDAAWRAAFDQPATAANTWRFGFDRLLLGHALASDGLLAFNDVVPVDDVEGDKCEVVGRIIDWLEQLFATLIDLQTPRTVSAWRDTLGAMVTRLLVRDDNSAGLAQPIFDELQALATRAAVGGFTGALELGAVRTLLVDPFEARRPSVSFLSGGLTFCAMLPMRTVPFRVIGLLGMDDGAFPRQSRGLGFDLMQRGPRAGDRNARDDDRTTFIETLLAVRDHLIVTWTGLRATDQRVMEPAGPVAELREALVALFGDATQREPMCAEHALQPFSPKNFEGDEPRSYDRRQAAGARIARGPRTKPPPHWTSLRLPAPDASEPLTLESLIAAFENPAGAFCRQRLQFWLGERDDEDSDREPIMLNGLEEWALRGDLLSWELAGVDAATRSRALNATGRLPLGAPGRRVERRLVAQVGRLVRRVRPELDGPPTRAPIEIELGERRLIGFVDHVYLGPAGAHRVVWQAGKTKPKHRLSLWIRHLALALSPLGSGPSLLVADDDPIALPALSPADARRYLGDLVALHDLGRMAPLPFFPATSWRWLEALRTGESNPAQVAREDWEGRRSEWFNAPGEAMDPHVALLFGHRYDEGQFPFDDAMFREVAARVLGPLLDRLELGFGIRKKRSA